MPLPEWAEKWLYAALSALIGGVAWFFTGWRADRIRREALQQAIVERLEKKNEDLQLRVQSLLADAYAKALEDKEERAERAELDKELIAAVTAMAASKDRSDALMVKVATLAERLDARESR